MQEDLAKQQICYVFTLYFLCRFFGKSAIVRMDFVLETMKMYERVQSSFQKELQLQ